MSKNKIVFAGVMGAILMSAGANAATTTTSIATRGYVDQEVGNVKTTVENIEKSYVTLADVTDAIESGVDLTPYQVTANMVQALKDVENPEAKYPSVAAVAAAIENLDLGLSTEQITQLQELIQSDGVVSQINALKGRVDTLTGEGEGSIAKSIADAISTHTNAADAKYQAQSTADYQIGMADGEWQALTTEQIAALDSGITKEIVDATNSAIEDLNTALDGTEGTEGIKTIVEKLQTAVNGLNGEDGTIAEIREIITELQDAINGTDGVDGKDGILKTITELQNAINDETNGLAAQVAANKEAIAENVQALSNTITKPDACKYTACVLMTQGDNTFWTEVTFPNSGNTTPEVTE